MSPLSAASAASIPKDKSFGARATVTSWAKGGALDVKMLGKCRKSHFCVKVLFKIMKPHFGFVSPNCLNIHTNPGQRENGKLVWRRRFMNQLRDPIYVGSLRPEPGNFLTLIPTDFSKKAKLLLRVPHSGHDLPHLGPIFDTGCCVIWH